MIFCYKWYLIHYNFLAVFQKVSSWAYFRNYKAKKEYFEGDSSN